LIAVHRERAAVLKYGSARVVAVVAVLASVIPIPGVWVR
jgi:hypothetical protein